MQKRRKEVEDEVTALRWRMLKEMARVKQETVSLEARESLDIVQSKFGKLETKFRIHLLLWEDDIWKVEIHGWKAYKLYRTEISLPALHQVEVRNRWDNEVRATSQCRDQEAKSRGKKQLEIQSHVAMEKVKAVLFFEIIDKELVELKTNLIDQVERDERCRAHS